MEELLKLLKLYLNKYIAQAGSQFQCWKIGCKVGKTSLRLRGLLIGFFSRLPAKMGFRGFEFSKMMAHVQVISSSSVASDHVRQCLDILVAKCVFGSELAQLWGVWDALCQSEIDTYNSRLS